MRNQETVEINIIRTVEVGGGIYDEVIVSDTCANIVISGKDADGEYFRFEDEACYAKHWFRERGVKCVVAKIRVDITKAKFE